METTTESNSTITLFDRANSQLQNITFQHSHHHQLCIFDNNEQEPSCCACRKQKFFASAKVTHCCHCWNASPTTSLVYIHCLVSRNIQQVPMEVNGFHFFHMEKFNSTSLFQTHFHVRHHFVKLPLCCLLSHTTKCNGILARGFKLYCHTTNIHLGCHGTI